MSRRKKKNHNWHHSDDQPISTMVKISQAINATSLLQRARDLNFEFDPSRTTIRRYTKSYNPVVITEYLEHHQEDIDLEIRNHLDDGNIHLAISSLNNHLDKAHKVSKICRPRPSVSINSQAIMNDINNAFEIFQNVLYNKDSTEDEINHAYEEYKRCRKSLNQDVLANECNIWNSFTNDANPKKLWDCIDWKGNTTKKTI